MKAKLLEKVKRQLKTSNQQRRKRCFKDNASKMA